MLPAGVVLQHFYDLKNVKSELLVLLQRFASKTTSDRKSRLEALLKNGVSKFFFFPFIPCVLSLYIFTLIYSHVKVTVLT